MRIFRNYIDKRNEAALDLLADFWKETPEDLKQRIKEDHWGLWLTFYVYVEDRN